MDISASSKLVTIPASAHFLESLAAGLLVETAQSPEQLRHYLIYLPNRRACRNLSRAFFRAAQQPQALILPRMEVLAATEEEGGSELTHDPSLSQSQIPPLQRVMIFAEMIHNRAAPQQGFAHSLALALALARLRDEMLAAGVEPIRLKDLVPPELAEHWQVSLELLLPVLEQWEEYLKNTNSIEELSARDQFLRQKMAHWAQQPPTSPIVMAGIIAPVGALTEFTAAVLDLPNGRVILPAVDLDLLHRLKASGGEVSLPATHPQAAAVALFKRLKISASGLGLWQSAYLRGQSAAAVERVKGFARVLVDDPPNPPNPPNPAEMDLRLRRFDCPDSVGEAEMIALHLRETIETSEDATAALVTRDRNLARRVTVELQRLGLGVDDSGGTPLLRTPPGVFMMLLLRAAAPGVSPSELLALLKHPLARAGGERIEFLDRLRQLEIYLLRGTRPGRGIQGVLNGLTGEISGLSDEQRTRLKQWFEQIEKIFAPLTKLIASPEITMSEAVAEWLRASEALAADRSGQANDLWHGEAGDTMARFCRDLLGASTAISRFEGRGFTDSIAQLAAGISVFKLHPSHRRIFIFGPAEARLIHCDRIIIGGLNEGSWPNAVTVDPWLSQPMRHKIGLATFDQQIGDSAHDFLGCYGAPEVIVTRSTAALREVFEPSRWLRLLDREYPKWPGQERMGWIGQRDLSSIPPNPSIYEPRPTPPLEADQREFRRRASGFGFIIPMDSMPSQF